MTNTILAVSKQVWQAMQQQNVDALIALTHPNALFVHMGATFTRDEEVVIIKDKKIVHKDIVFEETTVEEMGAVLVVLSKVKLTAVVDGNEVVNPFVVTEVYTNNQDTYKLASMSYTRINY